MRGNHTPNECYFKDAKFHVCGKLEHISPACRQKKQNNDGIKTNQLTTSASNDEHLVEDTYNMFTCYENMARIPAYTTGISINSKDILKEIDTGASLSVISDKVLYENFGDNFIDDMKDVSFTLKTYTGEEIKPLGVKTVEVKAKDGNIHKLPLVIVKGNHPSLLDRNWLKNVLINWHSINTISVKPLDQFLEKRSTVFQDDKYAIKGYKAKIVMKE